jgi:hypothetical protein
MTTFTIQIRLSDPLDDSDIDQLYESIADEVGVETGPKGSFLTFEREAYSFLDAALYAVNQVVKAGFEPVAVEDELVSITEIAQRLGRTRQSVSMLARGHRGGGGFPQPAVGGVRSPLWHWADVADYLSGHVTGMPGERTIVLAVINGELALRILSRHYPQDAKRLRRFTGSAGVRAAKASAHRRRVASR